MKMPDTLETTIDKFLFKVATDRCYNSTGIWALAVGNRVRIGLSDFFQQRSGDIAFADIKPAGTVLKAADEVAAIETIKVNLSLPSPVAGTVVLVNPTLESTPEEINQDPYGVGWLCEIEASNWEADRTNLLDANAYFARMKHEAQEVTKKR
jgi:glycine cleavage system H protein